LYRGDTMTEGSKEILDKKGIQRVIVRMAHEVLERHKGAENVVLVGMRTRGEFIARRVAAVIGQVEHKDLPVGVLDVSLYRDDFRVSLKQPKVQITHFPCDIHDKDVVLFDDVLFTGRTVRAALDEIMDFGRPRTIQLAVLIDRGHRELPISAGYVGKEVPTTLNEEIVVKMEEVDNEDSVTLRKVEK
jgi:pyrimidine operon attenuation protein/uracil phosphoribosyltransferase